MSLLQQHNRPAPKPDDDDDDYTAYPENDSFADDADDDNMSFDGVYDDEPYVPHRSYNNNPAPVSRQRSTQYSSTSNGARNSGANYYPGIDVCIVCQKRPPYSQNGKSYPTCGLTCAKVLEYVQGNPPPSPRAVGHGHSGRPPAHNTSNTANRRSQHGYTHNPPPPSSNGLSRMMQQLSVGNSSSQPSGSGSAAPNGRHHNAGGGRSRPSTRPNQGNNAYGSSSSSVTLAPTSPAANCVVCLRRPCSDSKFVTCGLRCAEKLCKGGADPKMCDYCHRRPKLAGHNQCGNTCKAAALLACLLCKSRPKHKRYHLCGKTCQRFSTKATPLILEAPIGHDTWNMVQKKFDAAWKYGTKPKIIKIYKIIEGKTFLQPYDQYKKLVGNEVFRYHGTSRKCKLGSNGNTTLCNDSTCALCCILKTSFKTALANPSGAFGAGVYSSSAANKAFSYSGNGTGAVLLTKVVLGQVYNVSAFGAVSSCPAGYNSVVFDRQNGDLNETIVYSDDAIRPVFLIMFQ